MTQDKPKQFLSIDQAINKMKADAKTMPDKVKSEASKQDISYALPEDQKKYLLYAISLLHDVDGDVARRLPETIRLKYSGRELAIFFRGLLHMKIDHNSNAKIAKLLGIKENIVNIMEDIAMHAVKRSIERARESGIALIGGA